MSRRRVKSDEEEFLALHTRYARAERALARAAARWMKLRTAVTRMERKLDRGFVERAESQS